MIPRYCGKIFQLAIFAVAGSYIVSGAEIRSGSDTVVADINGVKLTLADLEAKYSTALFQAYTNYYDAERKLVDELITDYVLTQQARRENVSVPELLERHVNSTIGKDPSEEALRVYYEGVDTSESYEAVRDKIVDAVRQRRIAKAKTAYVQELRKQWNASIRLIPPRMAIPETTTAARGPADAPVKLVEYADYECPYCQQIQPTVERLEAEFKGKLSFVYKDFPLPMHPNAQKAAEASRCAQAQGKYWEFHDLLTSSKALDPAALKAHARTLKLDTAAFDKCLDGGEKVAAIKADQAEAQTLGLQGTPSFFINGRYISGTLSYERLRDVVVEELGTPGGHKPPTSASGERR